MNEEQVIVFAGYRLWCLADADVAAAVAAMERHAVDGIFVSKVTIEDSDLSPLTQLPALSHVYIDKKKEYGPVLQELEKAAASRKRSPG